MRKILVYLLLAVLILGAFLHAQPVLASNITLAEYIGIVRVTNVGTTATNVFTVFNVTTQDMIDGDFVFQNLTNSNMQTNAGADTEYMPAPGTGQMWCVYVPSILENSSLDYKLYIGGQQDMDGEIRYFPANNGMTTLDAATLEPGADLETLANNWTIEWGNVYANTAVGAGKDLLLKTEAAIATVSDTEEITAGIYGTSTSFQYYSSGADATMDIPTQIAAQTFTTTQRHYIEFVDLHLQNVAGGDVGQFVIAIQATAAGAPTGVDLISLDVESSTIAGAAAWYKYTFSTPYPLLANTTYAIVLYDHPTDPLTNIINWTIDSTAPTYAGGQAYFPSPGTPQAWDAYFREYGYIYAEATGITSGKKTAISVGMGTPAEASGNTIHFTGAANSNVNCGAVYNAQAKLWVSLWFRLDSNFATGSSLQEIWGKYADADHYIRIYLEGADGKMRLRHQTGVGTYALLTSTEATWAANTWYHLLYSLSSVNGHRARINNGTALTSADVSAAPNGGNLVIGAKETTSVAGFKGEIAFVTVGTDDLTIAEETALYQGYTPGDETDLWYMDEGTGTAIRSFGSTANPGTAGAAASWETSTAPRNFVINVDGSPVGGHHVIDVPGNGNDWDTCQLNSMPFVEYQEITVDGVQRQYVEWENDETAFTDQSGNGNDATPTFRTSSSDVDVTAELISFSVVTPAAATGWSVSAPGDMIGAPTDPGGLYNETISTSFPFLPLVTDVMGEAGITPFFFIVPFFLLIVCIVGLLVGKFSLLGQLIIMTVMCFLAAPFGIPPWIGIIFLLDGTAFVIASKHYGW